MYLTFEINDFTKPVELENLVIDNRSGIKTIGVRSVAMWVGYYNVVMPQRVLMRTHGRSDDDISVRIPPGLYSADELLETIKGDSEWLDLAVDRKSGRLTATITQEDKKVKFTEGLKQLLIFDRVSEWISAGVTRGRIDMQPVKCLYLHCDQINRNETLFAAKKNARNSTVLEVIPIADKSWGGSTFYQYASPVEKKLEADVISHLKFSEKNSRGEDVDNHKLPIILNLVVN